MDRKSKIILIGTVTQRLFMVLFVFLVAGILFAGLSFLLGLNFPVIILCVVFGIIGGFLGIQRRLREMSTEELQLLEHSWWSISLSPLTGGFLAIVLFLLFVSGLLSGSLFPSFENSEYSHTKQFSAFLGTQFKEFTDIAKALFWSFLAGYSERFVPGIIDRIEGDTENHRNTNEK